MAISFPYLDGVMTLDMFFARKIASYCVKCYKNTEMMKIAEYVVNEKYETTLDPSVYDEREGSILPLGLTRAGLESRGYVTNDLN